MAPGPAISGMASGNAAILRTCSSSASSACLVCRLLRTPSTISAATMNSSRPPAMRNAGTPMPSWRSSQSPTSAVPNRIAPAIRLARQAIFLRVCDGRPCVTARKVGASPIGSTTTSRVTSAETR